MAIGLKFKPTTDELTGQSKWWGAPDLPEDWEYPCQDGNPLTFVCQIRCEDIAALDTDNLLPHSGMLYFFAAIGEYVNKLDIAECDHNGLGEWSDDAYKVLYADDCSNLVTYKILYEDEEPAYLPAEQIIFEQVPNKLIPGLTSKATTNVTSLPVLEFHINGYKWYILLVLV